MSNTMLAGLVLGLVIVLPVPAALADNLAAAAGLRLAEATGQPGGEQPAAPQENHIQAALKHARAAFHSGHKGDINMIAEHAGMAKTHVEAALKEKPGDPHLEAALKSLDKAIRQGELSNAEPARMAAHEAINHLKAVQQ